MSGAVYRRRIGSRIVALALAPAVVHCGARSELIVRGVASDAAMQPVCVPRDPPEEICNGRDDDCNGQVDEGLSFGPLGPAVELRNREGDTGSPGRCTSCRWAWSPVVAPLRDGTFQVRWYIGIYGGAEQPNIFTRVIDANGNPIGPLVREPRDVLLAQTQIALEPTPDGSTVVGVSFRDGTGDIPGWQIVHADGSVTSVRAPRGTRYRTPSWISRDRVFGGWSGDATVGADSSRFDASNAVSSNASLGMSFALASAGFGDHGGMIAATVRGMERPIFFLGVSPTGNVDGTPHEIAVPYESYPRLVGLSDGYLVIVPGSRTAIARRVRLDLDGDPIGPAVPFEDGRHLSDSGLLDRFVHHASEPAIGGAWQDISISENSPMHVERLDESGRVVSTWSGPAPGSGTLTSPSVLFTGDRMLVAWHDIAPDDTANNVYVQPFGCTP